MSRPRRSRRRTALLPLMLATFATLLAGAAGCGAEPEDARLEIHVVTAPGPAGERALADAERAVAEAEDLPEDVAVEAVAAELDGGSEWRSAAVGAAARTATESSAAVALIGPSGADAAFSAPITNAAGMLELAPGVVPEQLLRERPGGDAVPERYQPSGTRTLGALGVRRAELPSAPGFYAATVAVLDAIERAADPRSRDSVRAAYFDAASSPTPLGPLSVDPIGVATFG